MKNNAVQAANCNCVPRVDASLLESHKGKYELATENFLSLDSDIFLESLVLGLRHVKSGNFTISGLRPNYCPFCGVKYKSAEEIAAARVTIEKAEVSK